MPQVFFCECVGLPSVIELNEDKCLACGKKFEQNSDKDAIIVQFKTKEQRLAEIRFRHLADHLYENPCDGCIDTNSEYCLRQCRKSKNKY